MVGEPFVSFSTIALNRHPYHVCNGTGQDPFHTYNVTVLGAGGLASFGTMSVVDQAPRPQWVQKQCAYCGSHVGAAIDSLVLDQCEACGARQWEDVK